MALKTTPWDSAEYLKTEADIEGYLAACFEEAPDDAAFLVHALGIAARARNMTQLARDTGLTREGLYKAFSDNGNPSFGTVLKVARAMGYRLTVTRDKPGSRAKAKKRSKSVVGGLQATKRASSKATAKRSAQLRT